MKYEDIIKSLNNQYISLFEGMLIYDFVESIELLFIKDNNYDINKTILHCYFKSNSNFIKNRTIIPNFEQPMDIFNPEKVLVSSYEIIINFHEKYTIEKLVIDFYNIDYFNNKSFNIYSVGLRRD